MTSTTLSSLARHAALAIALGLPAAGAEPLSGPVLGAIALQAPAPMRADTEQVISTGRASLEGCLLSAHTRAPLADAGQITITLRVHHGDVRQAATILRPPRADLARCLHNAVKTLRFFPTESVIRLRITTDWFAPAPPEQANYPYPVRR